MGLKILQTKNSIIFASNTQNQSIYMLAGNILFCNSAKNSDYFLHLQQKTGTKNITPKKLAKIISKTGIPENISVAGGSILGLQSFTVYRRGEIQKQELKNNYPSLDTLAQTYLRNSRNFQLGIATKKNSRLILPDRFFTNEKYEKTCQQTLDVLAKYFSKKNPHTNIDEKQLFSFLEGFADSENFLDNIEQRIKNKYFDMKFSYTKSKSGYRKKISDNTIEEVLERFADFQKKQQTQKLILEIRQPRVLSQNFFGLRQELLEYLKKQLGVSGHAFKYANYLGLACEAKESSRILQILEKKSPRYFSRTTSLIQKILKPRMAYPIFTPELARAIRQKFSGGSEIISSPVITTKQDMWNLENINAYKAHKKTKGKNATIAIIDTGAEYNHPEISDNFGEITGYNFIDNSLDPYDGNSHGTHVSGTVAGKSTGVAPEANLLALKVLSDEGFGSEYDSNRAIEFCIDSTEYIGKKLDIDAANMSLGCPVYSQVEDMLTKMAAEKGIIISAAAGNEEAGYSYPAAYENVLAVAAVDKENEHAYFSNIADTNDISAPGVDIYSSLPGNTYGLLTGTSMASPHIAGATALAKSLDKNIDINDFRDLLDKTSLELGDPDEYGRGLVQLDKLVKNI